MRTHPSSRSWRTLSREEKQQRLHDLRHRQQAQIEVELRRLHAVR